MMEEGEREDKAGRESPKGRAWWMRKERRQCEDPRIAPLRPPASSASLWSHGPAREGVMGDDDRRVTRERDRRETNRGAMRGVGREGRRAEGVCDVLFGRPWRADGSSRGACVVDGGGWGRSAGQLRLGRETVEGRLLCARTVGATGTRQKYVTFCLEGDRKGHLVDVARPLERRPGCGEGDEGGSARKAWRGCARRTLE